MKTENIPLDSLYLEDERFRISYFFSLDKLILSLKEIGLVHPPLVTLRDNLLILVSGWKRVLACLELSLSPIPVVYVEDKSDLKAFLMAYYENLAVREFSLLEKAEILKRFKQFGEKEKPILKHHLPLLGIPPTAHHLDMYLFFSQLNPEIKKIIHEKHMSFASLEILATFSPQDREVFLPLLLPLNLNKQKELLEDFREISIRDDRPVSKIIESEEIRAILGSEKLSSLQKSNKIRHVLKKKRYPHLSSWEEKFDATLRNLDWPKDVSLQPSPFFEDDKVTLQFSFKNEQEFKRHLSKLQDVSSKKAFSGVFKPSSDE